MKKIKYILIIFCLIFISPVFANNINTDERDFLRMKFSPTENPVTYQYFVDYADMLRSKIDFKKMKPTWGMEYRYKVHSDGTISDLEPMPLNVPYECTKINEYFENLLLNNPPPPYPENMEIGDVYVHFYAELDLKTGTDMYFLSNEEGAYYSGNYISIYLYKKCLYHVIHGNFNYIKFKLFG